MCSSDLSMSPHIVLREAGLAFDLERVDPKTKKTAGGVDFFSVNPKGMVPVIELDNGERLTEGPAIVQYIADQKPDSGLAPKAGSLERYRLQEWLNYITSELHKTIGSLFNPALPADYKPAVLALIDRRLAHVEAHLAGKSYLMGEQFSVADGYLFTVLRWTGFLKVDISKFTNLQAFMARVAARPKVQEALAAEGLK